MTVADEILLNVSRAGPEGELALALEHVMSMSENASQVVSTLVDAITRDTSLSRKFLEAANSGQYTHCISTPVTTVAHAVLLLGLNTARQLAMSFNLMDKLFEPSQRTHMHEELAGVMLSCSLAGKLMDEVADQAASPASGAVAAPSREVAEVLTFVRGLGRLATAAYAYVQYREICNRGDAGELVSDVSRDILGATFDELSVRVAERLVLPERYHAAMQEAYVIHVAELTTGLSRALADRGLALNDNTVTEPLEGLVRCSGLSRSRVVSVAETAMREFESVRGALKTRAAQDGRLPSFTARGSKLLTAVETPEQTLRGSKDAFESACRAGRPVPTIAQRAAELLYLTGNFRNVLYCERTGIYEFQARAGAGECQNLKERMWIVNLGLGPTLLDLAARRGLSITLGEIRSKKLADKLPSWVSKSVGLPGSLVFVPVDASASTGGFFYCDSLDEDSGISYTMQQTVQRIKAGLFAAYDRANIVCLAPV